MSPQAKITLYNTEVCSIWESGLGCCAADLGPLCSRSWAAVQQIVCCWQTTLGTHDGGAILGELITAARRQVLRMKQPLLPASA